VFWVWTGLAVMASVPVSMAVLLTVLHFYLRWNYVGYIVRIFQEKPLFIIPRGQPVPAADDVLIPTTHGLQLHGCYLRTSAARRRGVILFGLEFGSNRWSCVPYCEHLLEAGFDVFAFEPRGQGDSPAQPDYDPLQWVTDFEVDDTKAALKYLKDRPDADPRGIGFFGISKGGAAGILASASDPWVRCFLTDGMFGTYSVMVPYMRKWYGIYNSQYNLQGLLPLWYYGLVGQVALRIIQRLRKCHFPYLERAMSKLAPRPLLMIHGAGDTYIKPEMAEMLIERARQPKELWVVEGAKHNQALHLVRDEYHRRVLEFFDKHLASEPQPAAAPAPLTSPAALARVPS